jgi:hypothetical protein
VHRLKDEGVACAWFYVDKGEKFILGRKPDYQETMADDFIPVKEARFIVQGGTHTRNTFNEYTLWASDPVPTKANPRWAEVEALEDGTVGFCLSTGNAKHRVITAEKIVLAPGETYELTQTGYLAVAENDVLINDESVGVKEIVRLSGKFLTLVGGSNGSQLGLLIIDFLE